MPQNDNDLVAAVEANAVCTVQVSIAFQAGGRRTIKFDFTLPAGATFNTYRYLANTGGGPTLRHDTIATASTVAILPGSATNDALTIQGEGCQVGVRAVTRRDAFPAGWLSWRFARWHS